MQDQTQNQVDEVNTQSAEVVNPEEHSEITSMDQFVSLLTAWHETKIAMLKHLLEIPDGVGITITSVDGTSENHTMSGDLRKGFQFGLTCAISEMGPLPFQYGFAPSTFPQEVSNAESVEQPQPN